MASPLSEDRNVNVDGNGKEKSVVPIDLHINSNQSKTPVSTGKFHNNVVTTLLQIIYWLCRAVPLLQQ